MNTDPVELTRKLIRTESTNPGCGEGAVAELLMRLGRELLPNSVEKELCFSEEGRPLVRFSLRGSSPELPPFIWICHMDTVPVGEGWSTDPFSAEMRDGIIYGRGSCDMKSGLAASLSAFIDFVTAGGVPRRTVCWIGTYDEEGDMRGVEDAIRRGWISSEAMVMDCEPTGGCVQTAHKGRFWYRCVIQGKAAHASEPHTGADAVAAAAVAITEIRKAVQMLPADDFLGVNTAVFGEIQGGIHPYQVPAACTFSIDMRIVPPFSAQDMKQIIEEKIETAAEMIPGIRGTVICTGNRPPIPHRPDSILLENVVRAVRETEGYTPEITAFPGYTDTAVIAGTIGCREILSYGPGSLDQAHQKDEYVYAEDILRARRVYDKILTFC